MDRVRFRVRVTGRVQGVGYRMWCVRAADDVGVSGWVRNCADGTVEAAFEGPAAAVEAMIARCWDGPRHALVSGVERHDEPATGEQGFRLLA